MEPGLRTLVARQLERAWGGPVVIEPAETLAGRHGVWRVRVLEAPPGAAESVVVKRSPRAAAARVALERLAGSGVTPVLLGADPVRGVLVLEDVGGKETLASILLGDSAERAARGLRELARALGRMHAWTAGVGGEAPGRDRSDDLARLRPPFARLCTELGLDAEPAYRELGRARQALREGGAFRSLTHGDPCPDNFAIGSQGGRFVDLDLARPGNALLDAAHLRLPFPTCWCVGRLEPALVEVLETEYRRALSRGFPGAADEASYQAAAAAACAYWLVWSATSKRFLADPEDRPLHPGLGSVRQRSLHWLAQVASQLESAGIHPRVATLAREMERVLHVRWPATPPLPPYPAFA